ncbi:MAG: hypothetical protein IKW51_00360 [Bacteroidales bacterium]|nr:hypothetical protein [Bacteroidales bacterium]
MWRVIKRIFFIALAFALMIVFHRFSVSKFNLTDKTVNLKEAISTSYNDYSLSSFKVEKDKMMDYAKILYQKELAEGKTDDKFEGFTIVSYCWKALDEYQEEINVTNSLSLFLPLIAAIMILVAIIVSIRLGLSAIRKLDFDNDATAY